MSPVNVISQKAAKVHAEALVAGFFQDDRPLSGLSAELDWIHNGIISRLILRGKLHGEWKETMLLATQRKLSAQKILLIGLGKKDRWTPQALREVYSHVGHTLSRLHIRDSAVELFGPAGPAADEARAVESLLAGLRVDPGRSMEITLLVPDEEKAKRIRRHVQDEGGEK
ncbi:MAG: hypothetical protein HY349_05330 [Nitrospirae bacterium]|nr:hypothetical protein [Nitrospirota bacterium]